MHVIDSAGRVLDATYLVVQDGTRLALIMESRSGRSATDLGRNSDYNPALLILLERLGRCDATIVDAFVDSKRTQNLGIPEAERRIVRGPIELAKERDMEALRLRMGRAQARIAQAPGTTKGGNATKRIRLVLSVPGYGPERAEHLADILAVPTQELSAPRAILERLAPIARRTPTSEDFASALAVLDGDLDRAGQAARRIEQSYLRRMLFPARTASCDLCGRIFEADFLVAAHIKMRALCRDSERRDVPGIVMAACRFGCDELFEQGYISIADDGKVILSGVAQSSEYVGSYVRQHLAGKIFGRSMSGRRTYFAWHRGEKFLGDGLSPC